MREVAVKAQVDNRAAFFDPDAGAGRGMLVGCGGLFEVADCQKVTE